MIVHTMTSPLPMNMALLLALGACTQEVEAPPISRPADAPDVFLLTVAGHCLPIMGLCDGNFNPEYLSHAGTAEALATPLREAGLDVETMAFVDGWYTWVDTEGEVLAAGFLDLVAHLQLAHLGWMNGFDDPTRIVLVGHGHGAVWAHLAVHVVPEVSVEVLVDLDGMSAGWDDDEGYYGVGDDWPAVIPGFVAEDDQVWPVEAWRAEDAWPVEGRTDLWDIEDVVPPNVVLNLEVHSTPSPFQEGSNVFDGETNLRSDGSTDGIRLFTSEEDHDRVYDPESDSLAWVAKKILAAL